jgi:hypothetical protein
MKRSLTFRALAVAAVTLGASTGASAGASDYSFKLVNDNMSVGQGTPVELRLVDPKGNPITGATFIRLRLDMAPEGMAQHTGAVRFESGTEAGVYRLSADFSMDGRWQLSLAARAPGEQETIVGKIVLHVRN